MSGQVITVTLTKAEAGELAMLSALRMAEASGAVGRAAELRASLADRFGLLPYAMPADPARQKALRLVLDYFMARDAGDGEAAKATGRALLATLNA